MVKIPEWYTTVGTWPGLIAEVVGGDINPDDALVIKQLASAIMQRWRDTADRGRANLDANLADAEFERLYKANEHNAKAAIIAILELINIVGAGKPLQSEIVLAALKQ